MKKRLPIYLFVIITVIISIIEYNFLFVFHASLNGDKDIVIDANSSYQDLGLNVIYRGLKYNGYNVQSNVNTNKLGVYVVKYNIGKKVFTRKVTVKDMSAPVITLVGNETLDIKYGETYKEPGYKAIDNYDGDVTSDVEVNSEIIDSFKLGSYKINYYVKDKAGNENTKTRIVNVVDHDKPVISISSNINTYSILKKKINLKDFKAYDSVDGDLTKNVTIEDNVNINKSGIYEVKYSVKDSSGNVTSVVKTINIQEKNTKGIPVLMYHWFYDDTKGEEPGENNKHNYISKTNLIEQLKYLKDNNYYFPTWDELEDYIDGKIDLPKKSVIITDDDCVKSFFEVALPVFQEYKVPVTSFCISNKKTWQSHVNDNYLTFESHTDSLHKRSCDKSLNKKKWDGAVMCTSYHDIYKDIETSIDLLKNTDSFAYPFGHYTDDTIEALKENGIHMAFTINNGRVKKGANKYKLPRVRISRTTTIKEYANKIK